MTRIYFTPTKPKPHTPLTKGGGSVSLLQRRNSHPKDHTTDCNGKPTDNHHNGANKNNTKSNNNQTTTTTTNNNNNNNGGNLDPSAIEQIADGLEKMVLSWSHPHQYVISDHLQCSNDVIANNNNGYGVHDSDGDHELDGDMISRFIDQEGNNSLISSDTIKSATMELNEDGEFSIDTKETTISYIHQRDPRYVQHHPHHQQTRIVETINENDGFEQDILRGRGDGVGESLLSVQNGQSCEAMENYPSMGNGVWYLNPPLTLPDTTICSGKEQDNCGTFHARMSNVNNDGNGKCGLDNERVGLQRVNPKLGSASLLQEKRKGKPEKISCKLEVGEPNSWSETIEINGGSKIKELLGKKLNASGNGIASLQGSNTHDMEFYKKKVEELQIALLECAMEYEVKIVEMKMEALQSKSHERIELPKEKDAENNRKENMKDRHETQRVEYLKKQLSRLQHEKAMSARELSDLRKRERQFDLQRRSLDDALCRVNFLQSELAKKEQDILDCRLREKEAKAQLYELQLGLQKAQAAQIEPRKLLTLLPALKDWIQSTKKAPDNPSDQIPPIDNIVYAITKEIQMLQSALSHISNRA